MCGGKKTHGLGHNVGAQFGPPNELGGGIGSITIGNMLASTSSALLVVDDMPMTEKEGPGGFSNISLCPNVGYLLNAGQIVPIPSFMLVDSVDMLNEVLFLLVFPSEKFRILEVSQNLLAVT